MQTSAGSAGSSGGANGGGGSGRPPSVPMEIPSRRRGPDTQDVITLFVETMKFGEFISDNDFFKITGIDLRDPTEKQFVYKVREHLRKTQHIEIDRIRGQGFRKNTDEQQVHEKLPERREKIHRAAKRQMESSRAIQDFAKLSHTDQRLLLAHQSTAGALALFSSPKATPLIAGRIDRNTKLKKQLTTVEAEEIVEAIASIKQS